MFLLSSWVQNMTEKRAEKALATATEVSTLAVGAGAELALVGASAPVVIVSAVAAPLVFEGLKYWRIHEAEKEQQEKEKSATKAC